MNEQKRFFKIFGAWNDEREEAWLSQMAQQGWHLVRPALGFYPFVQGDPKNIVYRMDYKSGDKDMAEYLQLFADAGWQHVGKLGGWQYFRKEAAEGGTLEIYTDNKSKIQKYQRVITLLIVFLPILIIMLRGAGERTFAFMEVVKILQIGLLVLYIYAIIRLTLRIEKLKKR